MITIGRGLGPWPVRAALLPAMLALAGCLPAFPPPPDPADDAATIDPTRFFEGATEGVGTLTTRGGSPRRLSVRSLGTRDADGRLTLRQTIMIEGKPPRDRRWVMAPAGPGRWSGQLTDAKGAVSVERRSGAIHIAYRMPSGLSVEQRLVPTDPATIDNRMTVRKWGISVARLHETIRRSGRLRADTPRR